MGGQTGLNCAVALAKAGVLDTYGVEVIGCDIDSIETGEDRKLFADAMRDIGLEVAESDVAHSLEECERIADDLGYPVVIRPAFTLGGAGGGMARMLDLEATDEDVRDEFVKAGIEDVEDEIENWRNQGRLPAIHDSIKRTKALDWLVENATVTEVDEAAEAAAADETDSATEE